MRVVLVLIHSVSRHLLHLHGHFGVATPNLGRFAKRAAAFENHYAGSMPCMLGGMSCGSDNRNSCTARGV